LLPTDKSKQRQKFYYYYNADNNNGNYNRNYRNSTINYYMKNCDDDNNRFLN